jgi:hypothetical protein
MVVYSDCFNPWEEGHSCSNCRPEYYDEDCERNNDDKED